MASNCLFVRSNSRLSGWEATPLFLPACGLPASCCSLQPRMPHSPLPSHYQQQGDGAGHSHNHWWLYTGPSPDCGFQAQASLLKGGSLTWNEMRLHLPSSTHSGDKHNSIPKRPCLRQGTDQAVHLANRTRGDKAPGHPDEAGRGRLEGPTGCTLRLCERRQWVKFPLQPLLVPARKWKILSISP